MSYENIYESSVKAVTLFLYVVDRKPTCVVDIPPRFNTVIIGFLSPLSAEMVGGLKKKHVGCLDTVKTQLSTV